MSRRSVLNIEFVVEEQDKHKHWQKANRHKSKFDHPGKGQRMITEKKHELETISVCGDDGAPPSRGDDNMIAQRIKQC